MEEYDRIVIGGGASGMMAAISAARNGESVLIIEKNKRLGEKLRISGGGRCNIYNAESNVRILLSNYGESAKFLFSAFNQFGVDQTRDFFENIGIPTKVEAKKRAFPISESAEDVANALIKELKRLNVHIATQERLTNFTVENDGISSFTTNKRTLNAKNYVISTGGTSRPETGSTGDGFNFLRTLGHTVKDPTPNITPLAVKETWPKEVSGRLAEAATISYYRGKKRMFNVTGDVLFTHFGISGPSVLNNAYKVAELLEDGKVTAKVDLFPKITEKELDTDIINTLETSPTKQFRNTIKIIAPTGLHKAVTAILDPLINLDKNNSEFSAKSRSIVVETLKNMPLTIEKLMGFEKAVVADGGVDLTEINTRTFQSNIISNLYVTGDLLDIRRPSGGYSLQLCWTSGFISGQSI